MYTVSKKNKPCAPQKLNILTLEWNIYLKILQGIKELFQWRRSLYANSPLAYHFEKWYARQCNWRTTFCYFVTSKCNIRDTVTHCRCQYNVYKYTKATTKRNNQFASAKDYSVHCFIMTTYAPWFAMCIDCAIEKITSRFDQNTFGKYETVECLLLNAASGRQFGDDLSQVCEHFGEDINHRRLQNQLTMLPDLFSSKLASGSATPPVRVTSAVTVASALAGLGKGRALFSEVDALLKLYSWFPRHLRLQNGRFHRCIVWNRTWELLWRKSVWIHYSLCTFTNRVMISWIREKWLWNLFRAVATHE